MRTMPSALPPPLLAARASLPLPLTLALALTLSLALTPPLAAQSTPLVLKGARVLPVSGAPIQDGVVVMAGGKVQVVGGAATSVPEGATVVDLRGKVVTPGLIDAAASYGARAEDLNEQGTEVTPQVKVVDSLDADDKDLARARAQGVTTIHVAPGNRNVIGGLGAVVKTFGQSIEEMVLRDEVSLRLTLGAEPSEGNRAIRGGAPNSIYYRQPTTRMGVIWQARKAFYDALAYRQRRTIENGDGAPPAEDAAMEVLLRAIDKKLPVRTTARAEQDIRTALRLAEEFGFVPVLEEATEIWRVVPLVAASGTKVVVGSPSALRERGAGARDGAEGLWCTLDLLAEAKVPFAIATGANQAAQGLREEALLAVRHGLAPELALRAITLSPAEILGVQERVGSLAAGKDADLVVWSGDPLDPTSRVERVYVGGVEAH